MNRSVDEVCLADYALLGVNMNDAKNALRL